MFDLPQTGNFIEFLQASTMIILTLFFFQELGSKAGAEDRRDPGQSGELVGSEIASPVHGWHGCDMDVIYPWLLVVSSLLCACP